MHIFSEGLKASARVTLLSLPLLVPLLAGSQEEIAPMKRSPLVDDVALQKKFRDVYGGELRVDSTFRTSTVVITNADTGFLFNIGMGVFRPGADKVSGYGGSAAGERLVMPKRLRMMRYPTDAKFLSAHRPPYFDGTPIVDVTVPVAERIPEETLDDLRKNGGSLRLKLRIHPDTLLVGWDIVRRPGYNPAHRDSAGNPVHVPAQYSSIGGDFCERQVWNVLVDGRLRLVEKKGWYIHPKSGQRIETDY